jgi:hypothetical protein
MYNPGGPTSRYLMQLYMPHLHGSVCYNNHASYYFVDTNTQICAGGQNQDFCDVSSEDDKHFNLNNIFIDFCFFSIKFCFI